MGDSRKWKEKYLQRNIFIKYVIELYINHICLLSTKEIGKKLHISCTLQY